MSDAAEAAAAVIDLRDRPLNGVMVSRFRRASAALDMAVADDFVEGRKAGSRLHEKRGKRHQVPT